MSGEEVNGGSIEGYVNGEVPFQSFEGEDGLRLHGGILRSQTISDLGVLGKVFE